MKIEKEINKIVKEIKRDSNSIYKSLSSFFTKHKKIIVIGTVLYVIYKFLFEDNEN